MTDQLLRDFKIGILKGDYEISLDISSYPNKWYFLLFKKRRIINDLFRHGAILTGSRALSYYRVNNKKILNRKPNDWDFIINRDNFLKFCKEIKYYPVNLSENSYHLDRSFVTFDSGYGESSIFPCDVQIIISDDSPEFMEIENKKIARIESIIDYKYYYLTDKKHKKDLNNILINIYE